MPISHMLILSPFHCACSLVVTVQREPYHVVGIEETYMSKCNKAKSALSSNRIQEKPEVEEY